MGDQVVVLLQGSTMLKVMMCRDKTLTQIQEDVRIRWSNILTKDVKLIVANVVNVEDVYAQFTTSMLSNGGLTIVKE